MRIGLVKSTALTLVALSASFGARADDNEVFIGQTGVTNTIFVDQLGDSNKVGANTSNLTLNQDGRDNDIDISQTGTDNQLGTQAGAPFDGVSQVGNLNFLVVQQLNSAPSGSNFVRALYQLSPVGTSLVRANDLTITQSSITSGAGLGSGEGAHEIGSVLQENTLANGATNLATITQLGGAFGDGHLINSVTQRGTGNALSLTQVDLGNTIDIVQQIGTDNSATVLQTAGSANIVEVVAQTGDHNQATATLTGSNNYILNITQNNALVALNGNIATISIAGDDNGGDGLGGLGQFTDIARQVGVGQAEFVQLGDDNILNFVVAASGERNVYGLVQDGDGNVVSGAVRGTENEVAAAERGDGNVLDFDQNGTQNHLAVRIAGDNNLFDTQQVGDGNKMEIELRDQISPLVQNAENNAVSLGGFTGDMFTAAAGLLPGQLVQTGLENTGRWTLDAAFRSQFSARQTGDHNQIVAAISGYENQSLVLQTGDGHLADYTQVGSNNSLIIIQ